MLHPHTALREVDPRIGLGVIATKRIPRGTITWALDPLDQVFPQHSLGSFDKLTNRLLEKYSYFNGRGDRILCWDHARFVNHCCEPATMAPGYDFEVALRDIEKGEELTCDYSSLNLERSFKCLCGAPGCRRNVRPADFQRFAEAWDSNLRDAILHVSRVPQALWSVVSEDQREHVTQAAEAPDTVPSVLEHLWRGPRSVRRAAAS
jgi:hypothetical protein